MARLFVSGEAIVDFVTGETASGERCFVPLPGGSPLNTAKAAAKVGARSEFLGALSTDFMGDMLAADLEAAGAGTSLAKRIEKPSSLAFVDNSSGSPQYAFYVHGTSDGALRPSLEGIAAEAGDIVHVGSIALSGEAATPITEFAVGAAPDRLVSLDPNVREAMIGNRTKWHGRIERIARASTILKLSDEDLAVLAPDAEPNDFAAGMLTRGAEGNGPRLVVVSRGAEGATAYTGGGSVFVAAPKIEVADTVGAGDTLMGSLLAWVQGEGHASRKAIGALGEDALRAMLMFATSAAAINCTRHGCNPPSRPEVEAFVAERG